MADLVSPQRTYGLVDILDRVLDKGLVVVGDIKINLANVELLTIQIRLLICSIDKAEQIGMNWWRNDPRLSAPAFPQQSIPQTQTTPTPASAPRKQESRHGS
ncbi:MAG TPA: gas vesicle protein [Gemmatimonadaceae bacterium]|nr:gas vesicle protein [Gemmatimonadaceae bacterium]